MMVETILECSQDFGMSGAVPQWKRELLQRRAARPRAPPPAPPPPPPPPPTEDDEELRYGPGIVKRLQSRYLSLALRDQPRRRASVLRRAASLEHLIDEPAACRPARPPRPASLAVAHVPARRDSIKRARSVDALSRLDRRPPSPHAQHSAVTCSVSGDSGTNTTVSENIDDAAPVPPRSARPPRRPQPLLRETEKPPPDLVRSALRRFEPGCGKRAPAARVAAVLRGLESHRAAPPRTSTPEPRARDPSPAADLSAIDEPEGASPARPVSRAALEGIAKAGSTMKFSFPSARPGTHLPPLAATNTVLVARRVGVIRPLPPAPAPPPRPVDLLEKVSSPRLVTPPPDPPTSPVVEVRLEKLAALVEPMPRSPLQEIQTNTPERTWETKPTPPRSPPPDPPKSEIFKNPEPLTNGHKEPSPPLPPPCEEKLPTQPKVNGKLSKISAAKIERAWSSPSEKKDVRVIEKSVEVNGVSGSVWGRAGVRAPPPAVPAAVSVVFNFSSRKEVPDYIENDGVILRASKRDKIKAGDPGVVVLSPGARADSDSDSDGELLPERAPSPCRVRFLNDNVLINGKSSLLARNNHCRINKLKLQFDDSLTRTFEYPSETSLCEEDSPLAPAAPALPPALLAANTHIASAALSGYTPHKTRAEEFRLGVTRHEHVAHAAHDAHDTHAPETEHGVETGEDSLEGDVRPCAGAARSWSEARTHHTDLLF